MPQNAIIRANGTGDYTSPIAWEAAEQGSNYGSITTGRVDGFFDQGGTALIITGGFVAFGARLEAFDSTIAFNGEERGLCGITSSQGNRTIRCRQGITVELDGLEILNSAGATAGVVQSDTVGDTTLTDCYVEAAGSKIVQNCVTNNTVLVAKNLANVSDPITGTNTFNNSTIFFNSTDSLGQAGTTSLTLNDSFVANSGAGADIDVSVTQSNNASTDTTADAVDNIVIASNFEDASPFTSDNYKISSGSTLDTNGIGAFIQTGGGLTINMPLIGAEAIVFSPEVVKDLAIEIPLIGSEAFVYSFDVESPWVIEMPLVVGETEVYSFEVSQPLFIEMPLILSQTQVYIPIVTDGQGIIIPVADRCTYQAIQRYLKSTGKFVSEQNNEIIVEWLKFEGMTSETFNELFYEYWGASGYTGAYNDRWKKWKDG